MTLGYQLRSCSCNNPQRRMGILQRKIALVGHTPGHAKVKQEIRFFLLAQGGTGWLTIWHPWHTLHLFSTLLSMPSNRVCARNLCLVFTIPWDRSSTCFCKFCGITILVPLNTNLRTQQAQNARFVLGQQLQSPVVMQSLS